MNLQKQYKIAAYCRLSREDSRHGKSSMSIENQKEMLMEYTIEKGWKIEHFYIDDGYTGTNFERPEFKRMLRDIDSGDINCVVTKDLSNWDVTTYIQGCMQKNTFQRAMFVLLRLMMV